MTAVTITHPAALAALQQDNPLTEVFHDAWSVAKRNLIGLVRTPTTVMFSTIQPIIFVLMFRYVFGGAIQGSLPAGQTYVNFLMPGIFVQTIVFGSLTTGVGLADDLSKGLIDRFRSLPMARSAVLVGRTLADFVRNFFVVILMCIVGFIVGWTIGTNVFGLIGAVGIILAFSYSLSWVFAIVGLMVKDAETMQACSLSRCSWLSCCAHGFSWNVGSELEIRNQCNAISSAMPTISTRTGIEK